MNLIPVEQQLKWNYSLPENFEFFHWEIVQREPSCITLFEGGMCRIIQRGKRAGSKCWKGRDKSIDRTFYITSEQAQEMEEKWAKRTGLCPNCAGKGRRAIAWSATEGTKYKPCEKCNGTGKGATP